MRKHLVVALVVSLWAAAPAFSNPQHANTDAHAIRKQQEQIRTEAEARSGRYKDLSEARHTELQQRQSVVMRLTEGVAQTTELKEAQQIELFNALEAIEAIEAIVNAAEDERMVCERHRPIGSNRPQTICKTVAERRAEREAARGQIGKRNLECSNSPLGAGSCN